MLGPMDFTTNDESGILIEGFDLRPMILEPWHPPYYRQLIEAQRHDQGDGPADVEPRSSGRPQRGRGPPGDLQPPPRRCWSEQGSRSAHAPRDMSAEVRRFADVYNEAWSDNWGFVPITDAEDLDA